jgi:Polysaccharide lyase
MFRTGRHRRWWRALLLPAAALVAGGALLVTSIPAGASVIYSAGDRLPGTATCPNGGFSWLDDRQEGRVIRVRVSEIDPQVKNSERCEFVGGGRGALKNGATIYVGWKSRLTMPQSNSWNGIWQAKCHGDQVADQPLVLDASHGRLTLSNHEDINGREVGRTVWSVPLPKGRWFSIVMKIRYSESRTQGYVQLWYDGQLQTLSNGKTIHYGQTWDGSENDMHWGIYRRSSVNGTQYHDIKNLRIATTFAEVNPA